MEGATSYQGIDIRHPHEHAALSGMLPHHLAIKVPAYKV